MAICEMHSGIEARIKRNETDIEHLYKSLSRSSTRISIMLGVGFGISFMLSAITVYFQAIK